ncbi:MAG: hypothetical protein ABI597_08545 [Gammaproteobacteria bacterium]
MFHQTESKPINALIINKETIANISKMPRMHSTQAQSLVIDCSGLSTDDYITIAKFISTLPFSVSLVLNNNESSEGNENTDTLDSIKQEGLFNFLKLIRDVKTPMTDIEVAIFFNLDSGPIQNFYKKLITHLFLLKGLSSFNWSFSGTSVGQGLEVLGDILGKNNSELKFLKLDNQLNGKESRWHLETPTKALAALATGISSNNHLQTLSLRGLNLDKVSDSLAEAVAKSKMTTLDLGDQDTSQLPNHVTEEAWTTICSGIGRSPSLKTLSIHNMNDLSNSESDDFCPCSTCATERVNETKGEFVITKLSGVLSTQKSALEALACGMIETNAARQAFTNILRNSAQLKTVDLLTVTLDQDSLSDLTKALQTSKSLTLFKVGHLKLNETRAKAFILFLQNKRKTLSVSFNEEATIAIIDDEENEDENNPLCNRLRMLTNQKIRSFEAGAESKSVQMQAVSQSSSTTSSSSISRTSMSQEDTLNDEFSSQESNEIAFKIKNRAIARQQEKKAEEEEKSKRLNEQQLRKELWAKQKEENRKTREEEQKKEAQKNVRTNRPVPEVKQNDRQTQPRNHINYLSIAFSYLVKIKYIIIDKIEDDKWRIENAKSRDQFLDDIRHFALLYNIFRLFEALKRYQNNGRAASIDADAAVFRNMIMHFGAAHASQASVLETAMQLANALEDDSLPQDFFRARKRNLMQHALSTEDLATFAGLFGIGDKRNFALNPYYRPVIDGFFAGVIERTPLYQELHSLHSEKQANDTANLDLLQATILPKARQIYSNLQSKHGDYLNNPDYFYEHYYQHEDALKMLLAITGHYYYELNAQEIRTRGRLYFTNTYGPKSGGQIQQFYKFIAQAHNSIRIPVSHNFPDCTYHNEISKTFRIFEKITHLKDVFAGLGRTFKVITPVEEEKQISNPQKQSIDDTLSDSFDDDTSTLVSSVDYQTTIVSNSDVGYDEGLDHDSDSDADEAEFSILPANQSQPLLVPALAKDKNKSLPNQGSEKKSEKEKVKETAKEKEPEHRSMPSTSVPKIEIQHSTAPLQSSIDWVTQYARNELKLNGGAILLLFQRRLGVNVGRGQWEFCLTLAGNVFAGKGGTFESAKKNAAELARDHFTRPALVVSPAVKIPSNPTPILTTEPKFTNRVKLPAEQPTIPLSVLPTSVIELPASSILKPMNDISPVELIAVQKSNLEEEKVVQETIERVEFERESHDPKEEYGETQEYFPRPVQEYSLNRVAFLRYLGLELLQPMSTSRDRHITLSYLKMLAGIDDTSKTDNQIFHLLELQMGQKLFVLLNDNVISLDVSTAGSKVHKNILLDYLHLILLRDKDYLIFYLSHQPMKMIKIKLKSPAKSLNNFLGEGAINVTHKNIKNRNLHVFYKNILIGSGKDLLSSANPNPTNQHAIINAVDNINSQLKQLTAYDLLLLKPTLFQAKVDSNKMSADLLGETQQLVCQSESEALLTLCDELYSMHKEISKYRLIINFTVNDNGSSTQLTYYKKPVFLHPLQSENDTLDVRKMLLYLCQNWFNLTSELEMLAIDSTKPRTLVHPEFDSSQCQGLHLALSRLSVHIPNLQESIDPGLNTYSIYYHGNMLAMGQADSSVMAREKAFDYILHLLIINDTLVFSGSPISNEKSVIKMDAEDAEVFFRRWSDGYVPNNMLDEVKFSRVKVENRSLFALEAPKQPILRRQTDDSFIDNPNFYIIPPAETLLSLPTSGVSRFHFTLDRKFSTKTLYGLFVALIKKPKDYSEATHITFPKLSYGKVNYLEYQTNRAKKLSGKAGFQFRINEVFDVNGNPIAVSPEQNLFYNLEEKEPVKIIKERKTICLLQYSEDTHNPLKKRSLRLPHAILDSRRKNYITVPEEYLAYYEVWEMRDQNPITDRFEPIARNIPKTVEMNSSMNNVSSAPILAVSGASSSSVAFSLLQSQEVKSAQSPLQGGHNSHLPYLISNIRSGQYKGFLKPTGSPLVAQVRDQIFFFDEFVPCDSNGSFNLLDITRKDAVRMLIDASYSDDKQMIVEEIKIKLINGVLGHASTREIMVLRNQLLQLNNAEVWILKQFFPDSEARLLDLAQKRALLFQKIDLYCTNPIIIRDYIDEIGRSEWLGVYCAKIIAKKKGFNLEIWDRLEQTNNISQVDSFGNHHNAIHLLQTFGPIRFSLMIFSDRPSLAQTPQASLPDESRSRKPNAYALKLFDSSAVVSPPVIVAQPASSSLSGTSRAPNNK